MSWSCRRNHRCNQRATLLGDRQLPVVGIREIAGIEGVCLRGLNPFGRLAVIHLGLLRLIDLPEGSGSGTQPIDGGGSVLGNVQEPCTDGLRNALGPPVRQDHNAELFAREHGDGCRGTEIESSGVPEHQPRLVVVGNIPSQPVKPGAGCRGRRPPGNNVGYMRDTESRCVDRRPS